MNTQGLKYSPISIEGELTISGSKSESNRLLMLKAMFGGVLEIENLSNSEDTQLIQKALQQTENLVDVHHAGTAMRFLTAYFSIQEGREIVITGSKRMKERPIKILVDALRDMGADIDYEGEEGFPPLRIKGKALAGNKVQVKANVSSQYISALMLIGAKLPKGLFLELEGKITSRTYINMSVQLLNRVGIPVVFEGNTLCVSPKEYLLIAKATVESDWSSVSYLYSFVALSKSADLQVNHFFEESLQGDNALVGIYKEYFGVQTRFKGTKLGLTKQANFTLPIFFELNMNDCPDIAQTVAVTAAALGVKCKLTGLETLKIKETDRLQALYNELKKLGVSVRITENSLELVSFSTVNKSKIAKIATYNDHRMAMAFAPWCLLAPIDIEAPNVVEKSYPDFWGDVKKLGLL